MARVNEDIKAALQEGGLWRRFCDRRDEMKAEGVSAGDAFSLALAEVLPEMESAGWRAEFSASGVIEGFKRADGEVSAGGVSVPVAADEERVSAGQGVLRGRGRRAPRSR